MHGMNKRIQGIHRLKDKQREEQVSVGHFGPSLDH